jgi:FkbM family methyltransferase
MEAPVQLKRLVYRERGDLTRLSFRDLRSVVAYVPDDERFGLVRELVLQRIYDRGAGFPRGVVVDAGANVGMFSLLAAQYAERVVALEPDPTNFRILQLNLEANGLENIEPRAQALWHTGGSVSFDVGTHSTGGGVTSNGGLRVDATTIDSLVDELGTIDFLKLDVEGAELDAIPSARRLEEVRSLVAELHLTEPGQERPLIEALTTRGFEVEVVPASDGYQPRHIRTVLRNWRSLDGQLAIKLGVVAYLLAPISKPRRPPGSRDMPLVFARRNGAS